MSKRKKDKKKSKPVPKARASKKRRPLVREAGKPESQGLGRRPRAAVPAPVAAAPVDVPGQPPVEATGT